MTSSYEQGGHTFPWFSLAAAVLAFVSYAACFFIAAKTRKLTLTDYLVGSLGMFCGFGGMYFLWRANAVTLQRSFDLIEEGGDPATSRALNQQFKIAAGMAIVFGAVSYVASRSG